MAVERNINEFVGKEIVKFEVALTVLPLFVPSSNNTNRFISFTPRSSSPSTADDIPVLTSSLLI